MPLRELFFTEPMLRATPLRVLNDPFEGLFNREQVKQMNLSITKVHGQTEYEKIDDYDQDYAVDNTIGLLQEDLLDLGILSFTEDFTNQLMWSHYANEHRGVVVEFDFTQPLFTNSTKIHNGKLCKFPNTIYLGYNEYPQNVKYRRETPRFDRHDLFVPKDKHSYQYRKFEECILLTKSNDWIYEKEHRSIVRLCDADRFICDDNKHIRDECAKDKSIEIKEIKGNKIQITFPLDYGTSDDLGDENLKFEVFNYTRFCCASALHLFRINPKAISSVFLGYRCNHESTLNAIRNNEELNHLNIFKIKINEFQYQLDIEKIN